jgi:hypothetical protein
MKIDYTTLFSDHNLALLSDWLAATGELYLDVDYPHSGGSGLNYRVRSMADLKALVVEQQNQPEISFTVFQRLQYPLRGVADDDLLAQALERIPDGQWYRIISLDDYYPSRCDSYGSGNTHLELRQDLTELAGMEVGIGQNPYDLPEIQMMSVAGAMLTISVGRNQNYYEPYANKPDSYRSVIDMWSE